ncbi:PilC/PilY family type IV pilus protein [Xylophilus sp. GW821-FHT01B05]
MQQIRRFSRLKVRPIIACALPALAAISFIALGDGAPPDIPLIDLSAEPLFAKGANDKPTLVLALSVEYPTVGAQYVDQPNANVDATYAPGTKYVGYFDTESCYQYVDDADASLRRFDRLGAATGRTCGGAGFSGNFMNWATSSAVDVLRLGLTGGDRVVDTATMTVLQRAVLPVTAGGFWNNNNFPSKQLKAALAAGAVPDALRRGATGALYSGDIFVANCLNRVHFGTAATGSCDKPGLNANLGTKPAANGDPTVAGSGFTSCANENATCNRPPGSTGKWLVAYGAAAGWITKEITGNSVACNNTAMGPDPAPGTGKSCYRRSDTSNWPPAVTGTWLSSDSFFYSRVQVCQTDTSGALQDPRASYCLRYPQGNYKPVGNMQKFSDRIRVAAFGYLMDDQNSRYGGVLRAPMKYVGPKSFDSSGNLISGSNAQIEWNENTGIFIANPDAQAEGKSGVINYLNQFGRTGDTFGRYKTLDPVGELYYESLRYLQGLPPTEQALVNMTGDMKQGFPVFPSSLPGSWTDPHAGGDSSRNYACLKNNILVIGDVNTHNDKSIPGNTRTTNSDFVRAANLSGNEPNFVAWTKVVGAFEAGTAVNYIDGSGKAQTTSNPNGSTGERATRSGLANIDTASTGASDAAYYMAGMAYWANTHDIRGTDWSEATKRRPGMRVSTYVLDVNENGRDSVKNTRRQTQFFLTAKYGGFKDASGKGNPYLNKAGVLDNTNWEKPDDPGEAKSYFLSSNAEAVLQALDNIFVSIAAEGSSIAGGVVSTSRITPDATGYTYRARFDPADWSGDVLALPLTSNTTDIVSVGDTASAAWRAGALLNNKAPADRKIYVGMSSPESATLATPFKWDAIETSLKNALDKPTPALGSDGRGELRLNYLRGDRSQESGGVFRKRGSVLGDIVNSALVYSGAPTRSIYDASYADFYKSKLSRSKALFVGANDGMLHAFSAATGEELFAYIPSWVGSRLSYLTNVNYNTSGHQSYVDGSSDVREALVGDAWKTVLVGATGAGGQGVFALDVSDPEAFDADKVLWEFTDKDDKDLGNVVGQPQIMRFRTTPWKDKATSKHFAVFTSGVNNYANDGNFSETGAPAIFMLDLSKGANTPWAEGKNYFKFPLPIDAAVAKNRATGALNFEAKGNAEGEVLQLYAGDLHGNLWKLDFTKAEGTSKWDMLILSAFKGGSTLKAVPLFIAKDAGGIPQPISMKPILISAPSRSTVVIFGTGKYLESSDNQVNANTQVQSVYALWDDDYMKADSSSVGASAISGRARLQKSTVSASGVVSTPSFTYGRAKTDADATQRSGWYFDFPQAGERQISAADNSGSNLALSSVIPPDAATDACGQGTGGYYTINVATGNGTYRASTVGLLGPPTFVDVGEPTIGERDSTGRAVKTIKRAAVVPGSGGTMVSDVVTDSYLIGRLSWRQINNYYELKKSP